MKARGAVWLACAVLAACDSGTGTSGPAGTGAIAVHNGASVALDEVYAEPTAAVVTFDAVRNPAPIPPGGSFTIEGLAQGSWDGLALVQGADADFIAGAWDLPVVSGQTLDVTIVDSDFSGRVRLTNVGASDITTVSATEAGTGSWRAMTLPAPIPPGQSAILSRQFWAGTYDLRCDLVGGGSATVTATVTSLAVVAASCG